MTSPVTTTTYSDRYSSLVYTYDNRDRVKSVDNLGTPNAPRVLLNYTYDDVGNMLSVVDTINSTAGGTNSYNYDSLNRLTNLTQSGTEISNKRVDFAYNALGQSSFEPRHFQRQPPNTVLCYKP